MSEHLGPLINKRRWIVPMRARAADEKHRASTPLELFFDLVFVVAVAQAASSLHHGLAEGHLAESVLNYCMVFFAIWWAWMNFTWFASAYDTDDVLYRLAVFVQLTGALILAVGVPAAFNEQDFTIVTIGYIVMRLALVAQWLRAARSDPSHRVTAHRYAIGITACQIGWIALLFIPTAWRLIGFGVMVIAELLVPIVSERPRVTAWHPGHIAERYGLFTIIVLGESILSASQAIQSAIQSGDFNTDLAAIVVGGLLIVFSLWWLYFDQPSEDLLTSLRAALVWGYGHLFIFASAAAVGSGLAVAVDQATHHAEVGAMVAGTLVTTPVAIYLLGLWALHRLPHAKRRSQILLLPIGAVLILVTPLVGQAVLLTGLLVSALLAIELFNRYRTDALVDSAGSADLVSKLER